MKRFFDSSVLVPVFYVDHPQHASCTKLFLDAGKQDFYALRTLGEVSTLTGLPLRPRITGPEGITIVKQIRERLTLVTLSEQRYVSGLELASSGTIVGAAAYDGLRTASLTAIAPVTRIFLGPSGPCGLPLES